MSCLALDLVSLISCHIFPVRSQTIIEKKSLSHLLQQHVINPYILPFGLSWISNVIQLMPIKGISTSKTELNSQRIKPKHWHCFSPLLAPSEGNKSAKNQPGGLCAATRVGC